LKTITRENYAGNFPRVVCEALHHVLGQPLTINRRPPFFICFCRECFVFAVSGFAVALMNFELQLLGAVTHTTVNGFSHGTFSRGTSHLGLSFPWFQQLHAKSDFPR